MGDISRQDRSLIMQALRVVNHIFLPGARDSFPRGSQLPQRGKGRLVREIVFPGVHGPQPQRAAFAGHGGSGDQMGLRILQRFLLAVGGPGLREGFQKRGYLLLVRVVNVFQRSAGLRKAVAHSVNMPVIQPYGGKHKFPVLYHRLRLSLWRVIHAIRNIHLIFPLSGSFRSSGSPPGFPRCRFSRKSAELRRGYRPPYRKDRPGKSVTQRAAGRLPPCKWP